MDTGNNLYLFSLFPKFLLCKKVHCHVLMYNKMKSFQIIARLPFSFSDKKKKSRIIKTIYYIGWLIDV